MNEEKTTKSLVIARPHAHSAKTLF
jgi:hypothetical protein